MQRHAAAHNRWTNYAAGARQHKEAMMDKTHGFNMQLAEQGHGHRLAQAEQGHGFNLERDTHQNELGADWRDFQKSHMTDSHNIARERLAQEGSHFNMGFDQRDRHHASARDLLERQFGRELTNDEFTRSKEILNMNNPDWESSGKQAFIDPATGAVRAAHPDDSRGYTGGGSGKPGGDGSGRPGVSVDDKTGNVGNKWYQYNAPGQNLTDAYNPGQGIGKQIFGNAPEISLVGRHARDAFNKADSALGRFVGGSADGGLSPEQKLNTANQNTANQNPGSGYTMNPHTDEQIAAIRKEQKKDKKKE